MPRRTCLPGRVRAPSASGCPALRASGPAQPLCRRKGCTISEQRARQRLPRAAGTAGTCAARRPAWNGHRARSRRDPADAGGRAEPCAVRRSSADAARKRSAAPRGHWYRSMGLRFSCAVISPVFNLAQAVLDDRAHGRLAVGKGRVNAAGGFGEFGQVALVELAAHHLPSSSRTNSPVFSPSGISDPSVVPKPTVKIFTPAAAAACAALIPSACSASLVGSPSLNRMMARLFASALPKASSARSMARRCSCRRAG